MMAMWCWLKASRRKAVRVLSLHGSKCQYNLLNLCCAPSYQLQGSVVYIISLFQIIKVGWCYSDFLDEKTGSGRANSLLPRTLIWKKQHWNLLFRKVPKAEASASPETPTSPRNTSMPQKHQHSLETPSFSVRAWIFTSCLGSLHMLSVWSNTASISHSGRNRTLGVVHQTVNGD